MPFVLSIDEQITFEINDGSDTNCQDFINVATSIDQCSADIAFNFTFTYNRLACVYVSNICAQLGLFKVTSLRFDDLYSYQERELCVNETWTVSDCRSNVNLCKQSESAWHVLIEVNESQGQQKRQKYTFEWVPFITAKTLSPSIAPSTLLSASPSMDNCQDCTLTGVISGGE